MANGIASLRRYQIGGGISDPEEGGFEWFKRILRQLEKRGPIPDNPIVRKGWAEWWNEDPLHGLPPEFRSIRDDPDLIDPMRIWTAEDLDFLKDYVPEGTISFNPDLVKEDDIIDELINLSNLDITFGDEGMSITPAPLPHAVPPLSAALQREADIAPLTGSDIWNVDDRYKSKLPAYSLFDSPHRSGIGSLLNRLTSSSIPWGSIAAPLLAAAATPAALAAETAFEFAISPEPLGGTASEVPGAGRTWRESLHIDPSDEEVASWMQTLLGDSPYSQSQLARPSTTSQRAIEQLIRNARAGTSVNRYRR